jgi:hypothetical protein
LTGQPAPPRHRKIARHRQATDRLSRSNYAPRAAADGSVARSNRREPRRPFRVSAPGGEPGQRGQFPVRRECRSRPRSHPQARRRSNRTGTFGIVGAERRTLPRIVPPAAAVSSRVSSTLAKIAFGPCREAWTQIARRMDFDVFGMSALPASDIFCSNRTRSSCVDPAGQH